MFDPEPRMEPKEPKILYNCDVCGAEICEGDPYYYIPEDTIHDRFCPDCARDWIFKHKMFAK